MSQLSASTRTTFVKRQSRRGSDEQLASLIHARLLAADGTIHPARARRHRLRLDRLEEMLWTRLEPRVRRLARRFESWWGDTDDLVQEAFVKFSAVIGQYDAAAGGTVWAWLRTVFHHHFVSLLRKRHEVPCGDAPASLLQPSGEDRDLAADLHEVLDTLLPDAPWRELRLRAFRLYWEEGRTIEELRRLFNQRSLSTVYKWLTDVAEALREHLPRACPCLFQPAEHLAQAKRLLERGKFRQALTLFRQVAELLPDTELDQREEARRLASECLVREAREIYQIGRRQKALIASSPARMLRAGSAERL